MSDTPPANDHYQYADRAQAALLNMVRDVLREAATDGLAGAHHFYITYYTQSQGVVMSDALRANHPEEITIVLQNQYKNLHVDEDGFRVTLNFNNTPEDLHVPFAALSKFYDPSVAFGLMFDVEPPDMPPDMIEEETVPDEIPEAADKSSGEVVSLDNFRDKP